MKNLKINDKKIKDVFKKGIALTAMVFTLATVSGCAEKQPADWPSEFQYISQEYNDFEKYTSTIIRNGKPITVYKGENIAIAINKETYEVKEYIFRKGDIAAEIYDLNTGYMIVDVFITTLPSDTSIMNNQVILDNYYVVEFIDINNYVEGHNLQENYTLEEIRNLDPTIVESVKKIKEYENNQQKTK